MAGLPARAAPRGGAALEAHLRNAMDLLDRELDAAIGRTRKTDLAVPIVAAEIFEPIG